MMVFLIGMPGSGKSTLGRALAGKLNWKFLDTDELIEEEEGKTISEIFQSDGELYFRERELAVLDALKEENTVISTGGGMPVFHNNLERMKSKGLTVFIHMDPDRLSARLEGNRERPLLKGNMNEKLETLYKKRLPVYRQADVIVEGEDPEILSKIIRYLKS